MLRIFLGLFLVGSVFGQWDPNFADDRYGIVHLFEWHWGTIADECEALLAPNKVGGVQTSPPTENRVVDTRPWWERYQPISYGLTTRSGNRQDFIDMVNRCNAVGVRIYPDLVINHMCGAGGSGTGTGGTSFNADTLDFPGVPYSVDDFNPPCEINNYNDAWQVRNCWLVALTDLHQGSNDVREKMIELMNDLVDIGVAGFRVDACKHMYPEDLDVIFSSVNNLRSDVYGSGKRPYIYQEVIDQGGEAISASEYFYIGSVTEFKYGLNLGSNKNSIQYLDNFGEGWGMMPSTNALVFINNHDNQRGHGGGGNIVTFEDPYDLKILTAYMLAWPYGIPRVMSSYYFSNSDQGPPGDQRSVETDGSCGNGWVCEHRWRQTRNMFAFAVAAIGTGVDNWWDNGNNQIAFSRGNKAFIAINRAGYNMNEDLYTGLPDGSYCNVIEGDYYDRKCAGPCVSVDGGYANIAIGTSEPILAIHTDAMTSQCDAGGGTGSGGSTGGGGGGGGGLTTCTDCNCPDSEKVDCGELASTEASCTAAGCLWCPASTGSTAPWCFYKASTSSTASPGEGGNTDGGDSCNDCTCTTGRVDCGELASNETSCAASGCLWCPLTDNSVEPWCFHPTGGPAPTTTVQPGGTEAPPTTTQTPDGGDSCNDCTCTTGRVDCGELASNETSCAASGCLWCPLTDNSVEPWCFHPTGGPAPTTTVQPGGTEAPPTTTQTPDGGDSCNDCTCRTGRVDCGELASNETSCAASGCLWCPLTDNSVEPWCFHPTGGPAPTTTVQPGGTEAPPTTTQTPDGGDSCNDCTCTIGRVDCGELASNETSCAASGCLWCPLTDNSVEPWCFHPIGGPAPTTTVQPGGTEAPPTTTQTPDGGDSCNDCTCTTGRVDCGELASNETSCAASGCLWCPLTDNSVEPWCFHPTGGPAPTTTVQPGGTEAPPTTTQTPGGSTCNDCTCTTGRVDCGELASTEASCTKSGCMWCPLGDNSVEPWCFHPTGGSGSISTPGVTQAPSPTTQPSGGTGCTDCNCPSTSKVDCGFMGIDQSGCQARRCVWCAYPANSADPWCFNSDDGGDTGSEVSSCSLSDDSKTDCGFMGIDQTGCESKGCCWAESNTNGVPWCYYSAFL